MKIGLFINYDPGTELTSEGLGRYLGSITKGFLANGNDVTIAYPNWLKRSVCKLLDDFNIDDKKIVHITTKQYPPIWYIYQKVKRVKKKRKSIKEYIDNYIKEQFFELASKISWISFMKVVLKNVFFGVLSVPFVVVYLIYRLVIVVLRKIKNKIKKGFNNILPNQFVYKMLRRMVSNSAKELVSIINKHNTMDVWYCPALFWPDVMDLNGPVVINLPDVVTQVFADEFAKIIYIDSKNDLKETIQRGKYFISYSEYIKEEIINREYAGSNKECIAIRHIPNILEPYIKIDDNVAKKMNVDYDVTHKFAKSILSQIQAYGGNLDRIDISNIHYIFYSSQVRPHKNILTLIKAYEKLVRTKFRHEKLILTGNVRTLEILTDYINKKQLSDEIIICSNVSTQQLAALYECADLVVNPTLYEGGFPFTFCEGMSVGTPSLMSDIPVVTEIIDPNRFGEMLFDPYDYESLANKIEWALDNNDYLYEIELDLYEKLIKRTECSVSKEYEEAFSYFIKKYNEKLYVRKG